jgi:uncharacterized LabA/DUF88 family protein
MSDRTFVAVDGENLVIRYQDSLASGAKARDDTVHFPDVFLWRESLLQFGNFDIVRVSYYTSMTGDDDALNSMRLRISSQIYRSARPRGQGDCRGCLVPQVFKKSRQSQKTRSVDIHLAIDVLRHAFNDTYDTLVLISGDGDYLPLIQEVMRQGKQVVVAAIENGLNPALRYSADRFESLDYRFFAK